MMGCCHFPSFRCIFVLLPIILRVILADLGAIRFREITRMGGASEAWVIQRYPNTGASESTLDYL